MIDRMLQAERAELQLATGNTSGDRPPATIAEQVKRCILAYHTPAYPKDKMQPWSVY